MQRAWARQFCSEDLYLLLLIGLKRKDVEKQWLLDRCKEVEAQPDGYLDLWSREHYKSSIITFAKTIQDILNHPERTFGIFSHTRPIAKQFLRQIKREFETNETLKDLFSDVLWANPTKEAPKWSEDEGIIVKRKTNPKEATVEAWGLVDGQPVSKHFTDLVYDDVVTRESVTSPDMIAKTMECLELSYSLGAEDGRRRFVGTRYHFGDAYRTIIDRGTAIPRVYPATVDGTVEGEPVLLTRESLAKKRRDMGPYTFSCQMLQNPVADSKQSFQVTWLRYHEDASGTGMNIYILVDAANEKKKQSDYTTMWVIGLSADENYYVLDIIRDRLNLTERGDALFALVRRWKPKKVGYEQYGMMADVQHMEDRMKRENYRFEIVKLGGPVPKVDRIKALMPLYEAGRILLPESLIKTDYEHKQHDLVQVFVEQEYRAFPVCIHDDMLDAQARILEPDLQVVWPLAKPVSNRYAKDYKRARNLQGRTWQSA